MKLRGVYTWVFIASVLSGCTVGPNYSRPDTPLPSKWDAVKETGKTGDLARWWETFKDPVLDRLIQDALKANLDMRLALARLREARTQLTTSEAALLPSINASGSATHIRNSSNAKPAFIPPGSSTGGIEGNLYKAGFDAQWELDIFGGARRSIEAAQANIDAAVEDTKSVQVSVLGEVARNYIELRGAQQGLAIARDNLTAQQETLALTQARNRAGLASGLDVSRAEAQVASAMSQIPPLNTSIKTSIYRIGVLTGREPEASAEELSASGELPVSSSQVLPGLPSELLLRRPDIRQAERQLATATAEIGVAKADLFPHFNLTALLGLQSSNTSNLFASGSRAWSAASALSYPLFDGGIIRANIEAKNAVQEQALIRYRSAVLTALEDVENSLNAYYNEMTRRNALAEEVEANKQSVSLANERYVKGLSSFLDLLDAERSLYSSQDQLSQSETRVSSSLVALYKSLGGGWEVP